VSQTHAPQYYNNFYQINKYNIKRNKGIKFFRSNGNGCCPTAEFFAWVFHILRGFKLNK